MKDAMNETRRQELRTNRKAPRLPRHVEDFLGQVLRNRMHDTVISPMPEVMTKLVEAIRQRDGSHPPDAQE